MYAAVLRLLANTCCAVDRGGSNRSSPNLSSISTKDSGMLFRRQISVASAKAPSRVSGRWAASGRCPVQACFSPHKLNSHAAHSTPSKSSSPGSGAAGGPFTTLPGAGVRIACTWRSMFLRAKNSPSKMTTGSDHVALVQRSFPPSMRSDRAKRPASRSGVPTPHREGPEITSPRSGGVPTHSVGRPSSRDRRCRRGGLYHTHSREP